MRTTTQIAGAYALVAALAFGVAHAQQPGSGQQAPTIGTTIQRGNHQFVAGPPPGISACGAGSTILGSDLAGIVVPQQTTCTITWANVWASRPICSVDGESTMPSWFSTPTGMSITATVAGVPLHYNCMGQPGG